MATTNDTPAEPKPPRVPVTDGWDKSADGGHWSKTVECASPEKASELARRLVKVAYKAVTPLTLTCSGTSVAVTLAAEGKKFAGTGAKVGRALRPVPLEKYVGGESGEAA